MDIDSSEKPWRLCQVTTELRKSQRMNRAAREFKSELLGSIFSRALSAGVRPNVPASERTCSRLDGAARNAGDTTGPLRGRSTYAPSASTSGHRAVIQRHFGTEGGEQVRVPRGDDALGNHVGSQTVPNLLRRVAQLNRRNDCTDLGDRLVTVDPRLTDPSRAFR